VSRKQTVKSKVEAVSVQLSANNNKKGGQNMVAFFCSVCFQFADCLPLFAHVSRLP